MCGITPEKKILFMVNLVSLIEVDRIDRSKLEEVNILFLRHFTIRLIGHIDFVVENEKMYSFKREGRMYSNFFTGKDCNANQLPRG